MRYRALFFATLGLVAVMGVTGPGTSLEAQQGSGTARTKGEVVGASVSHPIGWTIERERYTYDGSYGFTVWRPDTDAPHDHGGRPAVRVALAYDLKPGQIERRVREKLAAYPNLDMKRQEVSVAEKGYEGVAVGPIPGSTPFTEVYVPVNGRVYKINAYAAEPGQEGLGEDDEEMLSTLRFEPPSQPARSLGFPGANAPEALYASDEDQDLLEREQAAREAAEPVVTREAAKSGGARETRIRERCWRANPRFWVQTQHGKYANKKRWKGRRPGWSRIGIYNYWGQYSHGNLGYGRCAAKRWTNDKFAIDYPLKKGDVVFSPLRRGRISFAGRIESHKNYGIFVVIKGRGGKYVSLSAHLNRLARGIKRGARVNRGTIIGFAGNTGDASIPVGKPHLHQAFYRYPRYNSRGAPYGGAGLQVVRHHFVGTAARARPGVYKFGWKRNYKATCRRDRVCGEGYWISN